MTVWEYRWFWEQVSGGFGTSAGFSTGAVASFGNLQASLNQAGETGWEAVGLTSLATLSHGTTQVAVLLKRPKP
jgi:hypothetical protein